MSAKQFASALLIGVVAACAPADKPVAAKPQAESTAFLEANLLGIFYHELGHALIDIEGVPIFGQEEDAADTFSIFLIDSFFEEDDAKDLAYDAAIGFWAEAEARKEEGDEVAWWDNHGPDEQRFYNTVCIFYGADPDNRERFAQELDLPQERAEYCPEEYDQVNASWGAVIDELTERKDGAKMTLVTSEPSVTKEVIEPEIQALNQEFGLSHPLSVKIESCGEANAFYDPEERSITMCLEFEDHLEEIEKLR